MILATPADTLALGEVLGAVLRVGDVVTLSGPLAAGKTLFARGILRGLGHGGDVPSPTFPLVIPYDPPSVRIPVAHVDLYRIDDAARIDELALDELRLDGALLIEWPERLARPIVGALAVVLAVEADGSRRLTATVPEAWSARWPLQK